MSLIELAERVECGGDVTCPLCGETGFDIPGYVFSHENWCEVRAACIASLANKDSDIAAALRARAQQEQTK